MPALHPHIDPDGLMEFSVVFTDRSLNHMSAAFQRVMRDIDAMLREVYGAAAVALVPGGGTYAMEAVVRQYAVGKRALIVRNGLFSYRWSQILEASALAADATVVMARPTGNAVPSPYAPPPLAEVVTRIRETRPHLVFAPHVETSAGVILPEDYVRGLAEAAREVDALMVLDCIASGCVWVNMAETGVDILISAPQKGWSASPSAGMVMFSRRAEALLAETSSDSFAMDLKKWRAIMKAYEDGGHAYHATMPTDALAGLRDSMVETKSRGLAQVQAAQWELGDGARSLLAAKGIVSVAADGFGAPGVVVGYTDDPDLHNGRRFQAAGMQISPGVPLQVGEGLGFRTFRLGLFGLDKLTDVPGTLARLGGVLDRVV